MKVSSVEGGEVPKGVVSPSKRVKRVMSVIDFIVRIVAAISTLGSALSMGTARETLPFRTQFVKFRAVFEDLPTFVFFVMSNSIVCAYLVLSLPLSFFHILRTTALKSRILMVLLDTIMYGLLTAGAAAAAAIVFLAHRGNPSANWFPICQQYNYFCSRISGSVIGSFFAVVLFMILILMSSISISKN